MPRNDGFESSETRARSTARGVSFRLAVVYAALATVWILFSDRLLAEFQLSPAAELAISSAKGEAFVLVTAALLYVLSVRHLRRLYASEERHLRLFEQSTEGITFFRVERSEEGGVVDLVIDDINPVQTARLGLVRPQLVGQRMSGREPVSPQLQAHFDLVLESVREDRPGRAVLHSERAGLFELASTYPIERDLWALGTIDITEQRRAQEELRRQEERIREAYVDVLDAVTGGKLVLLTDDELDDALGEPLTGSLPLRSGADLSEARHAVVDAVQTRFPLFADEMALLSPLGEALNNTLKHAHGGTYRVFARGDIVQVCIADEGPGIDFRSLPKATLVTGYSTTSTLGMGFTIMLQLSDRVLLSTRPGRTMLVIELDTNARGSQVAEWAGIAELAEEGATRTSES